mgnify:CR=1 FL=1
MDRKRLTQRFPFLLPMRRAQRKMCFYAGMRFDAYSPKALRASMGALLRLPVIELESIEEILSVSSENGIASYAGVVSGEAARITDVDFSGGALIMVGNEGHGLSAAAVAGADRKIYIPMSEKTESLNAAAAASIMMWESRRRFLK